MMNTVELIALRARLIKAYANRHDIGAATAYVRALEAEVALGNFNSRRGSTKHLLALVDAALEARKKPPTKINRERDFSHPPEPLRGQTEIGDAIDEASFSATPVETLKPIEPPPVLETKPKKSKGKRVTHGKGKQSDQD